VGALRRTAKLATPLSLEDRGSAIGANVVLSLLTGARTEELCALKWAHDSLGGNAEADPPIPPHIMMWRAVRSRFRNAVPMRSGANGPSGGGEAADGTRWRDHDLVFASGTGTQLDAANIRRAFRRIAADSGLAAAEWTPRELRHSFVSLLSDGGVRNLSHPVAVVSYCCHLTSA